VLAAGEALAVVDGVAAAGADELADAVGVGVTLGAADRAVLSPAGAGVMEVSRHELSCGAAGSSDSGMSGFTDGFALADEDAEPLLDVAGDVGWSVGVGVGCSIAVTFAAGVAEIDCAGTHGAPAEANWAAEAAVGPPAGMTGVPNNG
jgi:hypothetical protein